MAYLSLYRRWRPQGFSDVVGQKHVVRALQNSLRDGKVSHAYLFSGPRGTGKTTVARLLAKGLNCDEGPAPEPCGCCEECQAITQGRSLNVVEIDGASNRGIDEIRELREQVRYAAAAGRWKIYVIDEIHMLTTEAFNALLKTLEEPPSRVVFVFATTAPDRIPNTIVSRCQRYDFRRFSVEEIAERLQQVAQEEGFQCEAAALDLIAQHSEGGMRDALGILDQCTAYAEAVDTEVVSEVLGVVSQAQLREFADCLHQRQSREAIGAIHDLYRSGKDLGQFTRDLVSYLRQRLLEGEGDWSAPEILRVLELLGQCERDLRYAAEPVIPLELAVVRFADIPDSWQLLEDKVAALEAELGEMKKQPPARAPATTVDTENDESSAGVSLRGSDAKRLSGIRRRWDDFLDMLRTERLVQSEAFLREGHPASISGDCLTVAFAKERGFHKASIEQDKHREPAERVLSKFFGETLRLQCITGEPASSDEADEADESQLTETVDTTDGPSDNGVDSAETIQPVSDDDPEHDETVAAALRLFGGRVVEVKDKPGGVDSQ